MTATSEVVVRHDFSAALRQIPTDVKYKHHGRDIEDGLDCAGLLVRIYRDVGLPIDDLDIPYGERDYLRGDRTQAMARRLGSKFRLTSVLYPRDCVNGDILLMGEGANRLVHCAIVIDRLAVQMAGRTAIVRGRHIIVGGKLRRIPLRQVFPFVAQVWRHGTIFCDEVIEPDFV